MSTPFDPESPQQSPSKEVATPSDFPQIDLNREAKSPAPAKGKEEKAKDATAKTPAGKKGKNDFWKNNQVIVISAASAVGLLLIFSLMMFSGSDKGSVSVRWKTSERQGARITVDGKSRKVPSSESFTLSVKPGQHVIDFYRDGFNSVRHEPSVKAGDTVTIVISRWTSSGGSKSGSGR